jgi:hypothetical protein
MRQPRLCRPIWCLVVVSCWTSAVLGDYYDNFNDGTYCQDPNNPSAYDPNLWDIDNPHWTIHEMVGLNFLADATDGWLRMNVSMHTLVPYGFEGAIVAEGDTDPNTSETWYDNSASHYILAKVKLNPNLDPNDGGIMLFLHGNSDVWTTYSIEYWVMRNCLGFDWINGLTYMTASGSVYMDPPNYTPPDEVGGFWLALEFDPDGPDGTADPNDPNNHWLRTAAWNGDKFDWDGQWVMETSILNNPKWDPNVYTYWTEGYSGIAVYASRYTGPSARTDAKFDGIECRWGKFTNVSHTLSLLVKTIDKGTVTIDPDLLDDSNNIDPNDYAPPMDPNLLRRYTSGTEVVLVAEPVEGKAFRAWKIYDPNYPGDGNHAVEDSNGVLYLTMDADYQIEAIFKCGSSEMLPPVGLVLLVLAAGALVRRLG